MEENMIVLIYPKIFYFHFYWFKEVDDHLKHKIEFIIKSNESLAENKIKNEIEKLSSQYEHGKIFMNMGNNKTNEPLFNNRSSKFIYLFQVEKYKKAV